GAVGLFASGSGHAAVVGDGVADGCAADVIQGHGAVAGAVVGVAAGLVIDGDGAAVHDVEVVVVGAPIIADGDGAAAQGIHIGPRSEERRVGKDCSGHLGADAASDVVNVEG